MGPEHYNSMMKSPGFEWKWGKKRPFDFFDRCALNQNMTFASPITSVISRCTKVRTMEKGSRRCSSWGLCIVCSLSIEWLLGDPLQASSLLETLFRSLLLGSFWRDLCSFHNVNSEYLGIMMSCERILIDLRLVVHWYYDVRHKHVTHWGRRPQPSYFIVRILTSENISYHKKLGFEQRRPTADEIDLKISKITENWHLSYQKFNSYLIFQ